MGFIRAREQHSSQTNYESETTEYGTGGHNMTHDNTSRQQSNDVTR
jgi:hypothetical protein